MKKNKIHALHFTVPFFFVCVLDDLFFLFAAKIKHSMDYIKSEKQYQNSSHHATLLVQIHHFYDIVFHYTKFQFYKKEPIPILSLNSIFSNCKKVGFYCDCFTPRHHVYMYIHTYGWCGGSFSILCTVLEVESILWQRIKGIQKKIKYFSLGCSFYSQFKSVEKKAIKINHFFSFDDTHFIGKMCSCVTHYMHLRAS